MAGRRWFRVLCLTVALVLAVGSAQVLGASAPASAAQAAATTSSSETLTRPDRISAMVTARATGKKVEVLSSRTGTASVYARPDGTWETAETSDPTRVQGADGTWHDLDPTLTETTKGLEPAVGMTGLVLSDGGSKTLASMTSNGRAMSWRWPSVLPKPIVKDATATYAGAAAGGAGDLVVTATRYGFRQDVILQRRPTAPVVLPTAITLDGGKVVKSTSGRISIQDAQGHETASAVAPTMWDATTNAGGDPKRILPVATTLAADPSGAATSVLTLTPDASFLADPSTSYPVTVDPTYTLYPSVDTWVMNADFPSSQYSSSELRAGTYDGGSHVARSFLKFSAASYTGQHVLAATLRLRNWYSGSCTGSAIRVNRITELWNSESVTWANQPSATATDQVDYSAAYGYTSSCGEDYASWDVTDMVEDWASGAATNYGLRIRAVNEGSIYTWRKYRSVDYSNGATYANPHLIVVTNSFPGTAADVTLAPVTTFTRVGSSTSSLYTADATPTFTSRATDSNGGTVRLRFEAYDSQTVSATSLKGTCTTAYVASGTNASCALSTALPDNGSYFVRAKAFDGKDWAGGSQDASAGWSSLTGFRLATQRPQPPSISCPAPYADGSWAAAPPSSDLTCTITAPATTAAQVGYSAPALINVTVDKGAPKTVKIAQSTDPVVAQTTVTVPKAVGGHRIVATAASPAGQESDPSTDQFGYGSTSLTAPAGQPMPVTTGTLQLSAVGPPRGPLGLPSASVKWRVAGSGQDASTGWNVVPAAALTGAAVTDSGGGTGYSAVLDTTQLTADAAANITLDPRTPNLIDLQVCLIYTTTTQCTWSAQTLTVLRVAHAFGSNFPESDVPGGKVALWTGELAIGATDASVAAPGADISLSRTADSLSGPASSPDTGVFGPGWSADLDGPGAGLGDMTLVDGTRRDGTLDLVDSLGEVMIFGKQVTPARRTGASLATGSWIALDGQTAESGTTLKVSGSGATTSVVVTDGDGTVTTYGVRTAPASGVDGVFTVTSVDEAGAEGATTYSRDGAGRVTRILAPVPAGVTCAATGNLVAGCRALRITYASATDTTTGTVTGQVQKVEQVVGGSTETATSLASYTYDSSKRLASVTDPRNGLVTFYTYDGTSSRIASITPPGLKPIKYTYDGTSHKLARVTRDRPSTDPAGGTATLATLVYDVPVSGDAGLPDLSQNQVAAWDQQVAPTYGAAVFGPNRPLSAAGDTVTASEVDADTPEGAAWADADLTYTDAEGRVVNTGSNGAGGWQLTSTGYDENNNVVRSLDEGDIAAILAGSLEPNQAGDLSVYNAAVTDSSGAVVLAAGSVVTDQYSAARWIRTESGDLKLARPHTHDDYDQGAPNSGINPATGQRYALVTTETSDAVDPDTLTPIETYSVTASDYSSAVSGDTSAGWSMGLVGKATTKMAGSAGSSTTDIVAQTLYDASGRVTETHQPTSNGTDDGTRKIAYYTASVNTAAPTCSAKPAWAGAVCQTSFAGFTPMLPTTTVSSYDGSLSPLVTQEKVTPVSRTTTNTYRADGQLSGTTLTTLGLAGSTAIGATTYGYSATTGMQVSTTTAPLGGNPGETISSTYDTWGRQLTYLPAAGETTTTAYNANGDVASVTDPQGTTSYTYDGTDATGKDEHRGLVTKLSISRPSASSVDITGAYDASGALRMQTLPGGVTERAIYDAGGEPTGLTYSGSTPVVDPDTGSVTGTDPDAPWLGWSQENDGLGRVRREWTPSGGAFDGATSTGAAATGFARDYTYDRAGRLVTVLDQTVPTANAGAGTVDPSDAAGTQTMTRCERRQYAFDGNGNRTGLTRNTADAGVACPGAGATGVVTKTWVYNSADRIATAPDGGSYAYDSLGRATTIPQGDTPLAAAGGSPGALTAAYYDNDAVRSLAQAGTTTTFGLDPAGRRSTSTTTPASGSATTVVRHYTDASDNPGWTSTSTGSGAATIERFAEGLDGSLGLSLTGATVGLDLADLHGDVVSTVDVPASGAASGISSWSDSDEYGNPIDTASTGVAPTNTSGVGGGIGYGWLGGKQRATDSSGLLLMGARLFNPVTGQFTSSDPVLGGNSTAYAYPQDPINDADVTGLWGFHIHISKKWKRRLGGAAAWVSRASTVVGSVPFCSYCSAASAALGVTAAGLYAASGNRRAALRTLAVTAVTTALGGAKAFRFGSRGRHMRIGRIRSLYQSSKSWLRRGGMSGSVARGAARAGRGRSYQRYTRFTNYSVRQGMAWDNW